MQRILDNTQNRCALEERRIVSKILRQVSASAGKNF